MRIFFSVGEPSGDLHGANLIRRMKTELPGAEFVGYGGPKMADAGCDIPFVSTVRVVAFAVLENDNSNRIRIANGLSVAIIWKMDALRISDRSASFAVSAFSVSR